MEAHAARGEYEIPLGRFGSLTPRVQYTWQDDTYFRVFNRDFDLQEAYHQTDAKLIWSSPEQSWSAEVFVENIEDEAVKQYILIGSRAFGSPAARLVQPAALLRHARRLQATRCAGAQGAGFSKIGASCARIRWRRNSRRVVASPSEGAACSQNRPDRRLGSSGWATSQS